MILPSAATSVMLGIVFVVNTHRYGWLGAAGGIVLITVGIVFGIRGFRDARSTRPEETAHGAGSNSA